LYTHAIGFAQTLLADRAAAAAADKRNAAIFRVKEVFHGYSSLGSLYVEWNLAILADRVQIQLFEITTITVISLTNCTGQLVQRLCLPEN
jgi:hypothetical protein